jgi:hypothetical protein
MRARVLLAIVALLVPLTAACGGDAATPAGYRSAIVVPPEGVLMLKSFRRTLLLIAMAAPLAGTLACGVPTYDSPLPKANAPAAKPVAKPKSAKAACAALAKEVLKIATPDDQPDLLKVRSPRVVKDNRLTFKKPTGDDAALLLSCRRMGVWSDGADSPVLLTATVDADGDAFMYVEPTY